MVSEIREKGDLQHDLGEQEGALKKTYLIFIRDLVVSEIMQKAPPTDIYCEVKWKAVEMLITL